jgi:microsomal epoxide hydrolase
MRNTLGRPSNAQCGAPVRIYDLTGHLGNVPSRTMRFLALILALLLALPASAKDCYFTTSDGARLHYSQSGKPGAPVIVFVPGWTMPGWIFAPQLSAFSRQYQVIAFDPRGQGSSEITQSGYDQDRRGQDIAELLSRLPGKIVIVGWSLGVLDTLAYIHMDGSAKLAGLVLVDNSVGENPPPVARYHPPGPALTRAAYMRAFVRGMFHTRQPPSYLARLTATCLRVPPPAAAALLDYDVPRSYWKAALLSTNVPVLYVVRPGLAAQAYHLAIDRPNTTIAIFPKAGHALFVDEATRFNSIMGKFLANNVWPAQ